MQARQYSDSREIIVKDLPGLYMFFELIEFFVQLRTRRHMEKQSESKTNKNFHRIDIDYARSDVITMIYLILILLLVRKLVYECWPYFFNAIRFACAYSRRISVELLLVVVVVVMVIWWCWLLWCDYHCFIFLYIFLSRWFVSIGPSPHFVFPRSVFSPRSAIHRIAMLETL